MFSLKLQNIAVNSLAFAIIASMFTQPANAFLAEENSGYNVMLSPALALGTGQLSDIFFDERSVENTDNFWVKQRDFLGYQGLVRVYDSNIEVQQSLGVSADILERVFKRAFSELNKRKVWSDFPSFYGQNDFLFGFKSEQKELYIIDKDKNIISLPVSLLDNFPAFLFTLRHVTHKINSPRLSQEAVLNADAFFFLKLFEDERKEILRYSELFLYENRVMLVKIDESMMENNFFALNDLLFKQQVSAHTNEELRTIFFDLTQAFRDESISKGRMLNFFMLLLDLSSIGQKNERENFRNLITGLKSIPSWSKLVSEANTGVFITKLDQLLSESRFGMHHTNSQVKSLLRNTVNDTLLYFYKIEQSKGGKNLDFRKKYSAPIKGLMGEISGLHRYTFVFKDTVSLLDEHPQIDSRNRVYVSSSAVGEDVTKECDAHTAGTIMEFKYSAHYRDIYGQIFGFMKQVSVFSMLLNAHEKKTWILRTKQHAEFNSSERELLNVKNVVYFAENDIGGLAQDVYKFVRANKSSFDAKTGLSLGQRTVWNEDGFSARFNLNEFKKLLLDQNMVKSFWLERNSRQGGDDYHEKKQTQYLEKYCDYIFSKMDKIYKKTGFDIYISISNPKLSTQGEDFINTRALADDIIGRMHKILPLSPISPLYLEQSI